MASEKKRPKQTRKRRQKLGDLGMVGDALFGAALGVMASSLNGTRLQARVLQRIKFERRIVVELYDVPEPTLATLRPGKRLVVRLPFVFPLRRKQSHELAPHNRATSERPIRRNRKAATKRKNSVN